uniref:iron-containing alcohol dehydrogenase n=1 Tax=Photobacterium leiognathi TaxID=553611 RepID=UPI00387ED601
MAEVSRFNAKQVPERFVDIAKAMGIDTAAMTQEQAVNAALEAIDGLSAAVGTKQRLADLGVTEDKLAFMAQNALN